MNDKMSTVAASDAEMLRLIEIATVRGVIEEYKGYLASPIADFEEGYLDQVGVHTRKTEIARRLIHRALELDGLRAESERTELPLSDEFRETQMLCQPYLAHRA